MKTKIGYKIVDLQLKSAIMSSSEFVVEYKLNEWVSPKIKEAPLMVFDNLYDAKHFYKGENRYSYLCIYKCEYQRSKRKWGCCMGFIDDILRLKKQKKNITRRVGRVPYGTVFADAVKLTERIWV